MADLTVTGGTRPKQQQTSALNPPLLFVLSDNNSDQCDLKIQYENVTPDPVDFTVAAVATQNTSASVVKTGAFASVKPGFGVSGVGIPADTTVVSKSEDNSTLTLSAPATVTGTATLTFTPPVFDATMLHARVTFSMTKQMLNARLRVWKSDGVANNDGDGDGSDDSTPADYGNPIIDTVIPIDVDRFLTNNAVAQEE